jgi:Carboxypeptidase regulatory-like domain
MRLSRLFFALAAGAGVFLSSALQAQDGSASLTGIVQDPNTAIIAGAPVTLQSETIPQRIFREQSDATGKFHFSDIPPDRYALIIQVQGFKWSVSDSMVLSTGEQKEIDPIKLDVLQGPVRPKDAPLEASEVRLVFPRGDDGTLVGKVIDLESLRSIVVSPSTNIGAAVKNPESVAPLADVQVTLMCDKSRVCGTTRTGADGSFRFRNLTPGTYGLRLQRPGYYSDPIQRVEVHRGLELLYRVYLEACQKGDCDPQHRVEPIGILL